MSVVGLSEAKAHLNIPDSADGLELQGFIDSAEAAIGRRVGPLSPVTKTERVRGGGTALQLSSPPVISVTSVTSAEGAVTVPSRLTVSSGGMVEFTFFGFSWFPSRFYDVVYQAGWEVLPADLRLAVLEMVRGLWETQRGNAPGAAGALPGDEAPIFGGTLRSGAMSIVEQILATYEPIVGA